MTDVVNITIKALTERAEKAEALVKRQALEISNLELELQGYEDIIDDLRAELKAAREQNNEG